MSNGDDVLDNWEEIDEVELNNKLQKIQAEHKTQQDKLNTTPQISLTAAETDSYNSTALLKTEEYRTTNMKVLQRSPAQNSSASSNNSSSTAALKSPLNDMAATFQPVMMVLHNPNDEYQSTNYAQPINTQTVKILRRPTQTSESRNNDMRPQKPIKTLQQREQEYAEARLRILGAAKNPEDDLVVASTTNIATTPTVASAPPPSIHKTNSMPKLTGGQNVPIYNNPYPTQFQHQQQNYFYQQQQQQQLLQQTPAYISRTLSMPQSQHLLLQHQQQTWSPVVGGPVIVNATSTMLRQQQEPSQLQAQESILRQPRGPDLTGAGFQMRR